MTQEPDPEIYITKASGTIVPFDLEKLKGSLRRAGADEETVDRIGSAVMDSLHEKMSTRAIYKLAYSMLKKRSRPLAARYNLKRAIMELGPSGFPFERYVAELLRFEGFQTMTGVFVQGACVTHEIDVIAEKPDIHNMVECKFHNEPGTTCDVKVPLYVHSRFRDIENYMKQQSGQMPKFTQGWLVTNTGFTVDAELYGTCAGLKLIGWNFPRNGNLRQWIDKAGLHPLTAMTSLARHEKVQLLEKGHVLCRQICSNPSLLDLVGIKPERAALVLDEANKLCGQGAMTIDH